MGFRVDEEPGEIEGFWFAIDRAILREHGVALAGPPPADAVRADPARTLLPLLQESIRWHRDSDVPLGSDTVLNTSRALRFATEGTWSSKREAGAWAADRADRARGARRRGTGARRRGGIPRDCGQPP